MTEVNRFLDECRIIDSPRRLKEFVLKRYADIFGKQPAKDAPLAMVKTKVAHRLQYVGMKSAGEKMSANFLKAYEASQKMDLEGMGDDLKFFIGLEMKREQQGEEAMAKVKRTKAVAAPVKEAAAPKAKKSSEPKPKRADLLAKAAKMGLKNRRAMNIPELVEVTKAGTSKARIDEILKKAVARWRSGLSK